MNLKEKITAEMKQAMKTGDRTRVSVLRMVNSKILEREVELRTKKGRDYHLSDEEIVDVLSSYAKQRHQSIDSYRAAGREDLVAQEEAELGIVQEYLPRQLSEAEVEALVEEAVKETGATTAREMGLVMKALMPKIKGAADGKLVNLLVKKRLGG